MDLSLKAVCSWKDCEVTLEMVCMLRQICNMSCLRFGQSEPEMDLALGYDLVIAA